MGISKNLNVILNAVKNLIILRCNCRFFGRASLRMTNTVVFGDALKLLALSICLISWSAEDDFLLRLTQQFEAYTKANPQVSVHLLFNQDTYVGGDTAFFKAYFVNEDFRPVAGKQILELEVIDQDGKLVQKQSFRVVEGKSENQIILSRDLQPGKYHFVAFSEWMKNFDESFFFSKEFLLAGRYQLAADKPSMTSLVSLFPEGGHLVSGVSNRVVIKSSPSGRVTIKNQGGETIVSATLNSNGLGEIKFVPSIGCYAELEGNNQKFLINQLEQDGIAIQLTSSTLLQEPQEVTLLIPVTSALRNQDLYLVVTARNRISFTRPLPFQGSEALQVSIPAQHLHPGLNQLSILDQSGNVKAERIFWKRSSEVKAAIEPTRESVSARELVTLDIWLKDDSGNPISGEGAISVINKNLFPNPTSASLDLELLLSELPQLRQYLTKSGLSIEEWRSHSDYYLIPLTWQRIPWKEIVEGKVRKPQYKFKNSMSLRGSGMYRETQEPLPDSTMIMIYLQKHMMGYELYASKGGKFELPFMYDFWGSDKLFCTVQNKGRELKKEFVIRLDDHPVNFPKELALKQTDSIETYGDYKFKKDLMDQSFNFYAKAKPDAKGEGFNPNMEFEDELGGADFEVNAQEFLVFPNMEEMIREILPFVQHRIRGDKVTVRLILIEGTLNSIPTSEPLYIIDGVMSKNTDLFLSLKPADILTVKVVRDKTKLSRLGAIGKNGVIFVQTKDAIGEKVRADGKLLSIEGLSMPVDFKLNNYAKNSNQRVPDFRSTLYWNPLVKTGTDGRTSVSFYASDDVGEMIVQFQGITNEGLPFSSEKTINVAFQQSKN